MSLTFDIYLVRILYKSFLKYPFFYIGKYPLLAYLIDGKL